MLNPTKLILLVLMNSVVLFASSKSIPLATIRDQSSYVLPNENVQVFKMPNLLVENFSEQDLQNPHTNLDIQNKLQYFERHLKSSNIVYQTYLSDLDQDQKYNYLSEMIYLFRNNIREIYLKNAFNQNESANTEGFFIYNLNHLTNLSINLSREMDIDKINRFSIKFYPVIIQSKKFYAMNFCMDNIGNNRIYVEYCALNEKQFIQNKMDLKNRVFFVSSDILTQVNEKIGLLAARFSDMDSLLKTARYRNSALIYQQVEKIKDLLKDSTPILESEVQKNPLYPSWKANDIQLDISSALGK